MATTVKTLRQRHPDYQRDRLVMIAALYEGGDTWAKQIDRVLPKNPSEPTDVWKGRKEQAGYFNHMGGLMSLLVGHLFSDSTQVVDGGDYWETLKEDADQNGTSWDKLWGEILLDALQYRQSFAWVNVPARGATEGETLADQEKGGALDAYLVKISGEDVIDWGEDAQGRLQWLMVETKDWQRPGPTKPTRCVWRWRYYSDEQITTWEWSDPDGKTNTPPSGETAKEISDVAHNYGILPVVRLKLPVALWMGDKLHDPALRLTRSENALDWALHMAAHALLWIKSKWGDEDKPVLGAGYYLRLGEDSEIGYVEPSGTNFEILRSRVKDIREEMFRVVQAMAMGMDTSAASAAQSGESKAMDWKSAEVMLTAYADEVKDAMGKVAKVVEAVRPNTAAPTFSGLNTGEEEGTDAFLERAAMALDAREFSPLFRKTVAKREADRILADEVSAEELKAIMDEIDGAVVEAAGVFMPTDADTDAVEEEEPTGDTLAESDVEPLNGAQIKSAKEIVTDVADGKIPRKVGIAMLMEFLGLKSDRAERIMGTVGGTFKTPIAQE